MQHAQLTEDNVSDNGDRRDARFSVPKAPDVPPQQGPTMSEMLRNAGRAADLDETERRISPPGYPPRPASKGPRRRPAGDPDYDKWLAAVAYNFRAMPPHILQKFVDEFRETSERLLKAGELHSSLIDVFDVWSRTWLITNPQAMDDDNAG